jgi:hypothetical protein
MRSYTRFFPWTAALCVTVTAGCGQVKPSQTELKQQLQANLPEYLQVSSFESKASDNLGTNAQPRIQTRFHARLTLKDDTFLQSSKLDSLPEERQEGIDFITKAATKGKTVDLYGVSLSRLVNEKWQTEFQYDTDPIPSLGRPRSSFGSQTVLRNSSEEQDFITKVRKQIEEDKAFLVSVLKGNQKYPGERRQDDADDFRPLTLQFKSFEQQSNKFIGNIEYPTLDNAVIEIEGSLLDDGLTFTTTKVLKGENLSVGTIYNMRLVDRNQLKGRWSGRQAIPLGGLLFGPGSKVDKDGTIPIEGDVFITLN